MLELREMKISGHHPGCGAEIKMHSLDSRALGPGEVDWTETIRLIHGQNPRVRNQRSGSWL
jgi:hypothetical protein